MLEQFVGQLNAIYSLSDALNQKLLNQTQIVEASKDDLLLRDGECSNHVTVVLSGLLRSYYIKDGREISSRFTPEGEVVLSVSSFYTRQPGYEFIQAVENCTLARISYEQMQSYLNEHLEFNYIVRAFTEKYYAASEEHLFNLRKQTAEEKWEYFQEAYPNILQRIPLKYIASFLGISNETLSRVRAKK